MHMRYLQPTLRRKYQPDNRKIVTLLFGAGLLWGTAFVCLFFPSLAALLVPRRPWLVVGYISRDTLALIATSLLGLIAVATLIAQVRGSQVPGWVFFLPTLFCLCCCGGSSKGNPCAREKSVRGVCLMTLGSFPNDPTRHIRFCL